MAARRESRHLGRSRYEISSTLLGRGAYGSVYQAKDKITNTAVAIKHLHSYNIRDGFPAEILREISLVRNLSYHANVLQLLNVVVERGEFFLVTELCLFSLADFIKSSCSAEEPCDLERARVMTIDIMKGMNHLHSNFVIHRDLKPANILVTQKGLKISDFGLARPTNPHTQTYSENVVTCWYRSPELLLGERSYDAGIDLWAAGCVFYEIVKGAPFFPGDSLFGTLELIFSRLGTPTDSSCLAACQLYSPCFPSYKAQPLSALFPQTLDGQQFVDLLSQLLLYDSKSRLSAKQALEHPFFLQDIYTPARPTKRRRA